MLPRFMSAAHRLLTSIVSAIFVRVLLAADAHAGTHERVCRQFSRGRSERARGIDADGLLPASGVGAVRSVMAEIPLVPLIPQPDRIPTIQPVGWIGRHGPWGVAPQRPIESPIGNRRHELAEGAGGGTRAEDDDTWAVGSHRWHELIRRQDRRGLGWRQAALVRGQRQPDPATLCRRRRNVRTEWYR